MTDINKDRNHYAEAFAYAHEECNKARVKDGRSPKQLTPDEYIENEREFIARQIKWDADVLDREKK